MPTPDQVRHPIRTGPSRGVRGSRLPPEPDQKSRHRFLVWDEYRVDREWARYEGTPLRDLYRELRERFLARHRPAAAGWTLEVGPGPGRFTHQTGHPDDRRTVLELSRAMLDRIQKGPGRGTSAPIDLVQGDAVASPFRPGSFHHVVILGNVIGFAEDDGPSLLRHQLDLVSPGGSVLIEFVAGPGERSRYLHRLPPGAIARLMAAPVRAVLPRVEREGFERIRPRATGARSFRRWTRPVLDRMLASAGFRTVDVVAVAPCLGNDASRLSAIRAAARPWGHLLELEEAIGRTDARQSDAAAVLLAAVKPPT